MYGALYPIDKAGWIDPDSTATLPQLRKMLSPSLEDRPGGEAAEDAFIDVFSTLWHNKSQLPEGPYVEPPIEPQDLIQLQAKKRIEELKFDKVEAAVAELPFSNYFSDEEDARVAYLVTVVVDDSLIN